MAIPIEKGDYVAALTGGDWETYGTGDTPDRPALVLTDGGTGASLVFTASNIAAANKVYAYYMKTTDTVWTEGGNRTGNGAITVSGLTDDTWYYGILVAYDPISERWSLPSTVEWEKVTDGVTPATVPPAGLQSYRHYIYDIRSGFWPMKYQATHKPTVAMHYAGAIGSRAALLYGGSDGYIRYFDKHQETDDGSEIASHIIIGPMTADLYENILSQLEMTLGQDSGKIDCQLLTGRTPEEASRATAEDTLNMQVRESGLDYTERRRVRGSALAFKLSNGETNRAWVFEKLMLILKMVGRIRL